MFTGGNFQEILSKKRHLLVTDLPATGEKFDFAIQNDIPVVTAGWFQQCLKQSKKVPFAEFLVEKQKSPKPETPALLGDPGSSKRTRDAGDSGHNKRPRLPRIDFQGGKLLGENLQSFGDRLRGKIPDKKTGADADAKTSGLPSKNRDTSDFGGDNRGERVGGSLSVQSGEARQEDEKMSILGGCVVCVSRQLKVHSPIPCYESQLTKSQTQARSVELNSVAKSLGASVVESFSPDDMVPITHLIHSSKTPRDTTKDFKLATATDGCHIVSPDWLFKCEKSGRAVDEKAYPPIIESTRGLEMDFMDDSSSSLSPVNTMEPHTPSDAKVKIERKRPEVNWEEDDIGILPPEEDGGGDLDTIYQPPRNPEPTPPISAPGLTLPLPLPLGARQKPPRSVQPAPDRIRRTPEPPDLSGEKVPASIGNILGKLGKGELTTAMDKRRKPRGKLQGKATSNLSSYSSFSRASSVSSSLAGSIPPSQQGNGPTVKHPKRKDANMQEKHEAELPAPSQAIRYEDPEAERERRSVRAKLSGDTFGVETPKSTKGAARRAKTVVDVEGYGSVGRRTRRNK